MNWYMIRSMAIRNLRAKYIGSFFGTFWSVINPLIQVIVFGVVFGVFFKMKPDPIYTTDNFFIFLVTGMIPWQFFANTIVEATNVLDCNSNLVKKSVGFSSEILPVVTLLTNLIDHLIAMGLVFVILLIFKVPMGIHIFLIPIYLGVISTFILGLGWVLSSINVYLKDTKQVIGVLLMAMFYFTPIFYSPSILPDHFVFYLKLNPMYHVVEGYRNALLIGKGIPIKDFCYLLGSSLLILSLGGLIFRKLKSGFAEIL